MTARRHRFHSRGNYYCESVLSSRSEPTRRSLVEAAIGQLADEGMRGLTHRKVEQRAGAAQGSVKYHFGSLDGLISAVLDHMVAQQIVDVVSFPPEDQAVVATGRVPRHVRDRLAASAAHLWSQADLNRARLELYLHASRRPELQAVIARAREHFVTAVAAALPVDDPAVAESGARLLCAAMDGLMLDELSAPHPDLPGETPAHWLALSVGAVSLPWIRAALTQKGVEQPDH